MKSKALVFHKFGNPQEVLNLEELEVSEDLGPEEVLVQWLVSPINPLDINKIQGAYAYKPELPAIGGSEGVGKVIKKGRDVSLELGDHVTIFSSDTSFWTEFGVVMQQDLIRINKRVPIALAATFMVNPPTAWVMLKEFVALEPGDYIIQNSANSGVGRAVIQLCHEWGIRSINIVRDRKHLNSLKTELWRIGATHVFSEQEFATHGKKLVRELHRPVRLALNGVGGRSALAISSVLEHGATCIVYGGMSRKAHEFSTSSLVFKDLRVRGVAIGFWFRQPENRTTFEKCFKDLENLAICGKITAPPNDVVKLEDFKSALDISTKGQNRKQLLLISSSNPSKL